MHFDPDGRFIYLDVNGVVSAALPSGEILPIGDAPADSTPFATTPDGKWMMFSVVPQRSTCGDSCHAVLQIFSTVTGATWTVTRAGSPLSVFDARFSPDSASVLLLTQDRNAAIVPAAGGEPRTVDTEVDQIVWAGSSHIVVRRFGGSRAGVRIVAIH